MTATIQSRRGLAADWTSVNPTLYAGEMGYETDTKKFKIGDGTTVWTSLPYIGGWRSYSATWKRQDGSDGVVGTAGSIVSKYTKIGTTVAFRVKIVIGTSGFTVPTTQWRISLPTTPQDAADASTIFRGVANDSGTLYPITGLYTSTFPGEINIFSDASPMVALTSTAPFTWAASDQFIISGVYESQ